MVKIVSPAPGLLDVSAPGGGVLRLQGGCHPARAQGGRHRGGVLPYDARPHEPPREVDPPPPARAGPRADARRLRRADDRGRLDEPRSIPAPWLFQQRCAGCHTLPCRRHAGGSAQRPHARAHRRPELQHRVASASSASSTRSRTAASPARSCRRTSSSASRRSEVADFVAHYAGADARSPRPDGSGSAANGFHCTARRVASAGAEPPAAVLDLRLIRRDPDARPRRARAPRATSPATRSTGCSTPDERWRELTTQLETLQAEQNEATPRAARRADATSSASRCARCPSAAARCPTRRRRSRRARRAARARCRTCPPRTPLPRTRCCARSARPARPAGTTSSWPGERIDMERGARLSGSRFAYLRGDLVLLELALVRWAMEQLARRGLRAGDPAGARARAGAVRHRHAARHRAADLPPRRRRPLPRRHLRGRARLAARGRDPRRRDAAAPLRRLLPLLPPRGRRRRQGHARHLPRAPVRQGRDVQLRRAGGVGGRARADPRDRGVDPAGARDPLPRRQHRGQRPRRLARRRSTTARRGCPARAATAS